MHKPYHPKELILDTIVSTQIIKVVRAGEISCKGSNRILREWEWDLAVSSHLLFIY